MEISQDTEYMARTLWGEARGENKDGQIAVGHVIKNRSDKKTWYGKTIMDVCLKKWQFSCWNENDPNRKKILALSLDDLEEQIDVASGVISGHYVDPTHGSTHYYAKSMPKPPKWAVGKEPALVLGNHYFFNNIE